MGKERKSCSFMPLQVLVCKAIMWPLDYVAAFPAAGMLRPILLL
jgi:hypothetical protein